MVSVPFFRGRKCSFRGIPSSAEEPIPKLGTERKGIPRKNEVSWNSQGLYDHSDNLYILQKISFEILGLPCFVLSSFLFRGMGRNGIPRVCFYICSTERNGIPSCFLFRWRVRKEIPRVCFYFCSKERHSELSLPLKCSEGNSESLLLVLFNGTEFRVIFSSAEGLGTEFRGFSVPWNSRNSVGNDHLFRLFRLPRN